MDHARLHARARHRGANPLVYWIVRGILQPFFHLYFRLSRVGREHVPTEGPAIFAANHRSFLDPFLIGTLLRRPMYYVAKRELFERRWQGWLLNALGAFPVDRGNADGDMIETAKAILSRGDSVLIFAEGTRVRPGPLGSPRRGVGRLALEAGVPVVPVAILGTEDVRRGWRIRPHKVRIRCGRPITFPHVPDASPQLAGAVTDRIWPCVMLQWEWLGGMPPLRRAAVVGAGSWGTALAVSLARAGVDVQLGCRTGAQARELAEARESTHYLPGVALPERVRVRRAADLEMEQVDAVFLAVPARALPAVVAAHGDAIPARTGVVTCTKGLVAPLGTRPAEYVAQRIPGRPVAALAGPAFAADSIARGASVVVASQDGAFAAQLADALRRGDLDPHTTADVAGVELAACAKNAAVLAAAAAAPAGPNAAGAAAGKVFSEVGAYAQRVGAGPDAFAGLAGAGDLVASVVAAGSRNRRAGELLAQGARAADVEPALGQAAEALEGVPLLAAALHEARVPAPALDGLAALVEGRVEPATWARGVTAPTRRAARSRAA